MPGRLRHLAPACVFLALALFWTFPLANHFSTHVSGTPGDNLAFLWNFWWMRQALSSPDLSFFHTDWLFAPFGADLTLHTHTALPALIGATLLSPLSVVAAQNVMNIGSLALNGFAAYLLALDRTGNRGGAVVGGVIFAGSTYIAVHLMGHFNLVAAWGLPLFVMFFLRALERPSSWLKPALAAGVVFVAVAFTDYYYVVYCAALALALAVWHLKPVVVTTRPALTSPKVRTLLMATLVAILAASVTIAATGGFVVRLGGVDISVRRVTNLLTLGWVTAIGWAWLTFRPTVTGPPVDRDHLRRLARRSIPIVLVALAGMTPLFLQAGRLWLAGDYVSPRPSWRSGPSGVDLATLVLGNPLHPLSGAWTRHAYDRLNLNLSEGAGWLGLVTSGVLFWSARAMRLDAEARRWLMIAAVFFVWALGPWLMVAGFNTGLPLPQNLFDYIPILSNARMPGRAMVMVFLAASVLAAIVLSRIDKARQRWAVALALLLVAVEGVPAPFPLTSIESPAIYTELRTTGAVGIVCELPVGLRDGFWEIGQFDDGVLVHQMTHGHPIIGGFMARIPPSITKRYEETPVVRSLFTLSAGGAPDPRDAQLSRDDIRAALRNVGIEYIVLNRPKSPAALTRYVETTLPIVLMKKDGAVEVYRIE